MKDVFLIDLFSNFLLAMLVMAVIAMRTQSDVPQPPVPASPCQTLSDAETFARLQDSGVVLVTASATKSPPPLRRIVAFKSLRKDGFKQDSSGGSFRVVFLEEGCVRARYRCGADAKVRPGQTTLDAMLKGCMAQSGNP